MPAKPDRTTMQKASVAMTEKESMENKLCVASSENSDLQYKHGIWENY